MTSVEPLLLLEENTLPAAALLLCFLLFVAIGLRVFVLGRKHYERVAEVPLHDDRVVEPRGRIES
jgi:hypothetical protein